MSAWLTGVSATITVVTLAALGLHEWATVRRGPGAIAPTWKVLLAVLVIVFVALMTLRLSSAI